LNESEKKIMGLISSAGESRAKAFQALQKVKSSDYESARQLIKESKEVDVEAHNIQTQLIQQELSGQSDQESINLLMVHAQDHYMTAQLARDLIEELIIIFENKE